MNDTNIPCIWNCGCGRMCYELFPCSTCMEIKYCDGVCAFCIDRNYQCKNKKFMYYPVNSEGEPVDIEDYIQLDIIGHENGYDLVQCYNKNTQQLEVLLSLPETAREPVPTLNIKRT